MQIRKFKIPTVAKHHYAYAYTNYYWSLASASDENNNIKMLTYPDACRDEILNTIKLVFNGCDAYLDLEKNLKIDFDKTRLLVTKKPFIRYVANTIKKARQTMLKDLRYGLSFVHLYERDKGWPLTEIHSVVCTNDKCTLSYNIVGPPQWIASPFSMSLYILLLRIGKVKFLHKKISNKKDFYTLLKKFIQETNGGIERKRIKESFRYWEVFMTNYEKIFKGRTPEINYSAEIIEYSDEFDEEHYDNKVDRLEDMVEHAYGDGISKLVKDESADIEISRRFNLYK